MTFLRTAVLGIVFAVLSLVSKDALAQSRIAVIDLRRAVAQTEDGMRAQATVKKLFESRQNELNKKQTDLVKQREELEKQAKMLAKDALQKRQEEWQKAMMELQQVFVEYNRELEKKERELNDPIIEKVQGLVKRFAAQEKYDMIIDRSAVPYVTDSLDITDRCIQEYNKQKGK